MIWLTILLIAIYTAAYGFRLKIEMLPFIVLIILMWIGHTR